MLWQESQYTQWLHQEIRVNIDRQLPHSGWKTEYVGILVWCVQDCNFVKKNINLTFQFYSCTQSSILNIYTNTRNWQQRAFLMHFFVLAYDFYTLKLCFQYLTKIFSLFLYPYLSDESLTSFKFIFDVNTNYKNQFSYLTYKKLWKTKTNQTRRDIKYGIDKN